MVSGPLADHGCPVCYTWKGLMMVCGGEVGGCRGGLQLKSWYVCFSKASRRLASPAQTAADPCGDSPASSCCRVPLKTPRPCLSDWPYGRQCHPGDPRCARHGVWEAWVGSMAASPNSHIPVILFLVSPQYVLTQLHAVIYSILRGDFPLTLHTLRHTFNTAHVNIVSNIHPAAHLLVSWLSTFIIMFVFIKNLIRCAEWTQYICIFSLLQTAVCSNYFRAHYQWHFCNFVIELTEMYRIIICSLGIILINTLDWALHLINKENMKTHTVFQSSWNASVTCSEHSQTSRVKSGDRCNRQAFCWRWDEEHTHRQICTACIHTHNWHLTHKWE